MYSYNLYYIYIFKQKEEMCNIRKLEGGNVQFMKKLYDPVLVGIHQ